MAILKVGDKLEVTIDGACGTTELIGAILTITKEDGWNPQVPANFLTDSPSSPYANVWSFNTTNMHGLKLLTGAQTIHHSYSYTLPIKIVVDDSALTMKEKGDVCECGATSVKDHMHSSWCQMYEPVWKEST